MNNTHFDLVILGGGPAGTAAALRAAGLGLSTALVEPGFLGGTCLNSGCVPTKYLLGASASLPLVRKQIRYKTAFGEPRFDFAALQTRKERYIKGMRGEMRKKLDKAGVTLFKGRGAFSGAKTIAVNAPGLAAELSFAKCIVAIGSTPASYPGLKPDGATVCSSSTVLNFKSVPQSLIIAGGGPIGLELGELLHRFGCAVTLAEAGPRLLPREDAEVSAVVQSHYAGKGWTIHTGRRISSLSTVDGRSVLSFADGEKIFADASLLCVGRKPSLAALSPEKAGLAVGGNGWLDTDENFRCAEHVYAVGDINGRMLIANAATHQALHAADHAAGRADAPYHCPNVPSCIYGGVEYMRVGPTPSQLTAEGGTALQSRAEMALCPTSHGAGHTRGFIKALWTNDALRSVYAVGHGASHLLATASLLVNAGVKKNAALPLISATPTLEEVLETALLATNTNIP